MNICPETYEIQMYLSTKVQRYKEKLCTYVQNTKVQRENTNVEENIKQKNNLTKINEFQKQAIYVEFEIQKGVKQLRNKIS